MPIFTLYQFPLRSCSTVTVNAFIELGIEFKDQVIDIMKGEQYGDEYLKIHPYGKVPALSVDSHVIIENVAILLYLDSLKPNILFPETESALVRASYNSDLVWCTGTMHPAIRKLRMPKRYTDGDTSGIRAKGLEQTTYILSVIEERLTDASWWYGDQWSIMDVYVNWGLMTAFSTEEILVDDYPAIRSHIKKVRERPSFRASLARQIEAKEKSGLEFPTQIVWKSDIE